MSNDVSVISLALSDSWGKMYIWLPGNGPQRSGGNGRVKRGNWLAYSRPIPSAMLRPLPITYYQILD
jgi:hypothetical protein